MSLDHLGDAKAVQQHSHLSVLSLELSAVTRQRLSPDPEFDALAAVSWVLTHDGPDDAPGERPTREEAVFVTGDDSVRRWAGGGRTGVAANRNVTYFQSEMELVTAFVNVVKRLDPGEERRDSAWPTKPVAKW